MVTTFDGSQAKRSDCRYIKGQFYIKNEHCFFIDGLWYRCTNNNIIYNHTTKRWVKYDRETIEFAAVKFGIVDIVDSMDESYSNFYGAKEILINGRYKLIFGAFELDPFTATKCHLPSTLRVIMENQFSLSSALDYGILMEITQGTKGIIKDVNMVSTLVKDFALFKKTIASNFAYVDGFGGFTTLDNHKTLRKLAGRSNTLLSYKRNCCTYPSPLSPLPYNVRHCNGEVINRVNSYRLMPKDRGIFSNNSFEDILIRSASNKEVPDYTFGIEFETNSGQLEPFKLLEGHLVPLRDGSIRGIEYATLPMSIKNSEHIAKLYSACNSLKAGTHISEQEGTHIHIGGFSKDKTVKGYQAFIGKAYTLMAVLEKEIYTMFPSQYMKTSQFKSSGKDYNNPLIKGVIKNNSRDTFQAVYSALSTGKQFESFSETHPSDDNDSRKWQIDHRYFWVNFIPAMFNCGNMQNVTIEFRVHTPTTNFSKLLAWFYICSAIIKYADTHSLSSTWKCLTISDILKDVYDDTPLYNKLVSYVRWRKSVSERDRSGFGLLEIGTLKDELDSF